MGFLSDRIVAKDNGLALREGPELAALEARLKAGATLVELRDAYSLSPADMAAALAYMGLGLEGSEALPLVQGRPARPFLARMLEEPALATILPEATRPARLALAAGLLLIHDFWDASHHAAQEADDLGEGRFSAYWHGIAHRREPDAGNASYWFRRVGRHELFGPLGIAAGELIAAAGTTVKDADRIVHGGTWDPFAFIAYCGAARAGSPAESLARRLQRLEMAMLLDLTAAHSDRSS